MQFQPVFHRLITSFNVLSEPSGVVHVEALLYEPLHGLLVVVGGVLGTGAGKLVLGPGPEALDGHVVGAVGAVEDELYAKFWRQLLNCFCAVDTQIVEK